MAFGDGLLHDNLGDCFKHENFALQASDRSSGQSDANCTHLHVAEPPGSIVVQLCTSFRKDKSFAFQYECRVDYTRAQHLRMHFSHFVFLNSVNFNREQKSGLNSAFFSKEDRAMRNASYMKIQYESS